MVTEPSTGPARYTSSHGFEISGDVGLFGLRLATGRPTLRIRRGLVDRPSKGRMVGHWPAIPDKRAEVSVVAVDAGCHVVTVGEMARFLVDTGESSIVAQYAPPLPRMMETTTLMSSPAALSIARRGQLAIHAGAVEIDGRSVLLAAPGTGGKTTFAAAFHIAGHRVLSDDLVGVDPTGWVEPAVALLRLRTDAADALAARLDDVSLLLEDVGKRFFEIAEHRRGDGAAVPAAAIVFLAWSADGHVAVEEVASSAAIQDLWRLSFYLQSEPGPAETFERLAALVDRVPCFVMRRPRDLDRLDEGVSLVENLLESL